MKGIELAEKFYTEYGAPMLREGFLQLEGLIAVGIAGSGSECLGYDDELSQDHDLRRDFAYFFPMSLLSTERPNLRLNVHIQSFPRSLWDIRGLV